MEKLYRSSDDKIVFGVCGGLGKYFNVDSTLIRLIFILGAFLKGATILIYIVLAIITPEEKEKEVVGNTERVERVERVENRPLEVHQPEVEKRRNVLAFALIVIGVFIFAQEIIPFWISDSQLFAFILILIGLGILLRRR